MDKYWKIIVVAVVVLLIALNGFSYRQTLILEGERNQLKKELSSKQDEVVIIQEINKNVVDSLNKVAVKRDKKIEALSKENARLYANQAKRDKELEEAKEKIASYTFEQSAKEFRQIYKTKSVTFTETSVNLESTIPNKVLSDLAEGEACKETVLDKDQVIKNNIQEIALEKERTSDANLKTSLVVREKDKINEALGISIDLNKKSEKQIKKQKNQLFLGKVFTVLGAIGGFIIGSSL